MKRVGEKTIIRVKIFSLFHFLNICKRSFFSAFSLRIIIKNSRESGRKTIIKRKKVYLNLEGVIDFRLLLRD